MTIKHALTCALLTITTTSCDRIDQLKAAIPDIDASDVDACGLYMKLGEPIESDWATHDWPTFAPIFETPPDAAADLSRCHALIASLGATIVTKPEGQSSATAVCKVVAFPFDFASRSIEQQAAVCMHESGHIVEQDRVGCKPWLVRYAKASGRIWSEAIQYATKDALLEHYGVPLATIEKEQTRRAKRFPGNYMLGRAVTGECVARIFSGVRERLRVRAGV